MFDRTERLALISLGAILAGLVVLLALHTARLPAATAGSAHRAPVDDTPSGTGAIRLPTTVERVPELLERLDESIKWHERRFREEPTSWIDLEAAAGGWMERARYTGSYDDYAQAQDAL